MSSQDTRFEEELEEEAIKADDTSFAEAEIESGREAASDEAETEAKTGSGGAYGAGEPEFCETDSPEKQAGTEKKSFFGKKKEKKDPKDEKIEELTDRLQRNMAEFDNFRKRTEKEKTFMFEVGARDIIEKLLPVVDNFERGLAAIPEEDKGTPFADGMEMIYKQLMKMLEDAGVRPIEAAGKPFDPDFHNAVMHIDDESLGENIVVQELQKGYIYRETVVRHSMVQVAN